MSWKTLRCSNYAFDELKKQILVSDALGLWLINHQWKRTHPSTSSIQISVFMAIHTEMLKSKANSISLATRQKQELYRTPCEITRGSVLVYWAASIDCSVTNRWCDDIYRPSSVFELLPVSAVKENHRSFVNNIATETMRLMFHLWQDKQRWEDNDLKVYVLKVYLA